MGKLIEYYTRLFIHIANQKTNISYKTTRSELSEILVCSERNVIHIINKLEEERWIETIRGRGRGNATQMTFHHTLDTMFEYFTKINPKTADIDELISIIEESQLEQKKDVINSLIVKLFGIDGSSTKQVKDNIEILKIPYFRPLYSLEPSQAERQTERHIVRQMFNTLVIFDEETNRMKPSLAHYWEVKEGGKRVTFYLRKGILFHNYKTLTSADVKFTFERLQETDVKWIIKDLKSITCVGNYVVQFEFTKPSYHWMFLVASSKCSIIPIDYGNKTLEEFSIHPIGSGPFKIMEHKQGVSFTFSVFENYFQERAHLDEITIHILPSIEKYLHISALEDKPILYMPFTTKRREDSQLQFVERSRLSVKYLVWNMKKDRIGTNPTLRKQLFELLNTRNLIDELGYPRHEQTCSFIKSVSSMEGDTSPKLNEVELFYEPLTIMTYDLTPNVEDVNWIKQQCKKYGIPITIKSVPYATFIQESHKADIVLGEYVAEEIEENSLYHLYQSSNSVVPNLLDQENEGKLQHLLNEVTGKQSQNDRMNHLRKVEELLIEEHIVLPIYWTHQKASYNENLMGVSLSSLGLLSFDTLFYRKT
ncbi:ABC transporter substrate-binding protein [Evansella sp. AB-rgal1]|uniref:ABC transporter substrate-binding protein n=1 Tax=Evansella sp. AB-rgal1 TaxID=3242696 RepID=UPI00359DF80E